MKKLISLVLALMMVFSLATVAAASGTENQPATPNQTPEKGSITINNVAEDAKVPNTPAAKYEIYTLLDLESYDPKAGAYSYKVNADWTNFFALDDTLAYVAIDEAGYVTWKAGEDDDTVAAFAKKALAYAEANGIDPVKSTENADDYTFTKNAETGATQLKFEDLDLGWYLIDSDMGALCGLTTTNPDASINAKNGIPTIDKQVQEDSTNQWADQNTADIGQTVKFRVTINVHAGAQNYILHDVMTEGLTFDKVTSIEHIVPGTTANKILTEGVDYEVYTNPALSDNIDNNTDDGCTMEVHFSKDFCDTLETNDKIVVHYQAMLNRKALVADKGNENTAHLEYGDHHETTDDVTKTYTYGFDIVKTDSQNKLIDGAEFKIYDAATSGNEVAVVLMDDGVTYRRARADETGVAIVVKDGQVRIVGFDNGTYYLEETVAPEGYNKLTARQKFIISDGNLDATFNDGIFSTGSGVHVVNKTGSMLPETGAMGTTMFLMFGSFVVLATGVLLVTKKRMSMIEE